MLRPCTSFFGGGRLQYFVALITNPNVLFQFPHVVLSALATGGFFAAGISAWHLMRRRHNNLGIFRASMPLALWIGTIAVLATMGAGHAQAQRIAATQPMKLAAAEGLWESEDPAGLSLFQIGDEDAFEAIVNIRVPSLLSFLAYNTLDGLVHGIRQLQAEYEAQYGPGNYVPPAIWLTYWSFRAMIGAGAAMFALGALGLILHYIRRLERTKWVLYLLLAGLTLPYIANTTGWLLTEVGRQPWIVQGLMTVDQAVSPAVSATMVWISLLGFALVYTALIAAHIFLMQKFARDKGNEGPAPWRQQPFEQGAAALRNAY